MLQRRTGTRVQAVATGVVVTSVLQSSSVVNLLVLAFVGAGMLSLPNALAVVLGSNLGTTISNWVIATVGFSFNIADFALPLVGIAGIAMALMKDGSKGFHYSRLLLGFAFLFFGLGFIREGVEVMINQYDFSGFDEKSSLIHLIAGFIITSLIQSSSATMAIILSLLNAQGITLETAMGLALGSEMGTAVKLILASIGGNAVKKQVAMGNFLFNIIICLLIFLFIGFFHTLITETFGLKNPLFAIVAFQSLVNVLSILVFAPLVPVIADKLEKWFKAEQTVTRYIHAVGNSEVSLAMQAMEHEVRRLLRLVLDYNRGLFDKKSSGDEEDFYNLENSERYEYLKTLHGKIHNFGVGLFAGTLQKEESIILENYINSNRNCLYAAKSLKDAEADIRQLFNSSNNLKYDQYQLSRKKAIEFCNEVARILDENDASAIAPLYERVVTEYNTGIRTLHEGNFTRNLSEVEISTLLNFNRELISAFKSVVFALKELLLDEESAAEFDNRSGFIR